MKNRIKRHNGETPDIEKMLRDIEAKQRDLLNNTRSNTYVDKMGTVQLKPDGTLNEDGVDIIAVKNVHTFFDLTRSNKDFSVEDINALVSLIPSVINTFEQALPTAKNACIMIGERIGDTCVSRYIERHHEGIGKDKENAVESVRLTEAFIKALSALPESDVKALCFYELFQGLSVLEKWRDGIEIDEELTFEEGQRETYKKALEYCQRYGLDARLIDRASDVIEEHLKDVRPMMQKAIEGDTP